jgi:hypothetical protein
LWVLFVAALAPASVQHEAPLLTGYHKSVSKWRKIVLAVTLVLLFLWIAGIWWRFAASPRNGLRGPVFIGINSILCLAALCTAIRNRYQPPWLVGIQILAIFLALGQLFSLLYWRYGTSSNFNLQLTHLDAIYFMLGTLTTAGTGNIVAISESARAIQSVQMCLDLGLTVVGLGIFVSRLFSRPNP